MRIAKPLLMFSLSVFLLAVSWGHFAGGGVASPASAQGAASLYPGPPIAFFGMDAVQAWVVDSDGYPWRRYFAGQPGTEQWTRYEQILAPGTPIPTGNESMGSLKSQHGDQGQ